MNTNYIPLIAFVVVGALMAASASGNRGATMVLLLILISGFGFLALGAWGALQLGVLP